MTVGFSELEWAASPHESKPRQDVHNAPPRQALKNLIRFDRDLRGSFQTLAECSAGTTLQAGLISLHFLQYIFSRVLIVI